MDGDGAGSASFSATGASADLSVINAMTIATANTLLSDLVGPDASSIPSMADVAEVVRKLAQRFSKEALIGSASRYGRFEAALFGYCTSRREFLTYILGDIEDGSQGFSLQELKVLSEGGIIASIGATDAKSKLDEVIGKFRLHGEPHGRTGRWPRLAVEAMVEERPILSVGGAISIGIAMQDGFRAYYNSRPLVVGQPPAWRSFNGIDVDEEIGLVGPCTVGMLGMA